MQLIMKIISLLIKDTREKEKMVFVFRVDGLLLASYKSSFKPYFKHNFITILFIFLAINK